MKLLKIPATLKGITARLREVEHAIAHLHRRAFLTPPQERLTRELKLLRLLLKDRATGMGMAPA